MASNTRQSNLFALQDWKTLYTTFSDADFQSYDFETIRKVLVDYIRNYYSEDFNDFIESSEFIALIDLIAFSAQANAFRADLNARENFLDTAQRQDSVHKLSRQLGYSPNRNKPASGVLKINSITTTESLIDINGNDLSNRLISWDDSGNSIWQSQFNQVLNSAIGIGRIGKPFASKTINNILVQQYNLSVPDSILPVFGFNSNLEINNSKFEIVGANIAANDSITEQDPGVRGQFGLLYQNDGKGNSSSNSGFFLYFRQGTLQQTDFNIAEKIPNQIFSINTSNINNEDVWLYSYNNGLIGNKWLQVQSVYNNSSIYNTIANTHRQIFSVNTRLNDQIDLVFSDGTFGDIPYGNFKLYYRVSNGLTYRISPSNMSNIVIKIPYINKNNLPFTLTILASLQYTVSNASRADSITEIKQKAPQAFYAQGRMVNGEDYNLFPYTQYPDIVKVKAVNRMSVGSSRGIDLNDPTGSYSSTNLFGSDGAFYKNQKRVVENFNFTNRNDVLSVLNNQIMTAIKSNAMKHFYYENYSVISFLTNIGGLHNQPYLFWQRATDDNTTSSGFFVNSGDVPQMAGNFSTSTTRYLLPNGLVKFVSPAGHYFDKDNVLMPGDPVLETDRTVIWAGIQNIVGDGTIVSFVAGRKIGSISLTENIPTGAIVDSVYPPWTTTLQNTTVNTIVNMIYNNQEFGLVYNQTFTSGFKDPWTVVSIDKLDTQGEYNRNTAGTSFDTSWLMLFQVEQGTYKMTYRAIDFVFGSSKQIRFLNTNPMPVFDATTNTMVYDTIKVLKNNLITQAVDLRISGVILESDGFNDSSRILVSYAKNNKTDLPMDPEIFSKIVTSTLTFYEKFTDTDNLLRYNLLETGMVTAVDSYSTYNQIQFNRNNFPVNKLFYASQDKKFYKISLVNNVKTVVDVSNNYLVYTGRQDLNFQYRHNSNNNRRLDPAITNVIDLYVLVRSYDEQYRNYVLDSTNSVAKPMDLDTVTLSSDYSGLYDYKMISDELIINAGVYKPLFGNKAALSLQANFYVVKNPSASISDNELKSRIIEYINDYFALENWDFGDTFYFSELSGFLHSKLSGMLNSIVITPVDSNNVFGSLYEIRCQPNEIFISAATVDNIKIVSGVLSGLNNAGLSLGTVA